MPRIIEITDINADELSVYTSLTDASLKRNDGLFIAEGVKVIKTALSKGIKPISFLMERRQIAGIGKELAESHPDIPIFTASREVLSSITGFELTRGLLCAMKRPETQTLEAVLKNAKRIAVLEKLSDAANVGAIFRSAAALGIDAVLLFQNCSEPLNRRTVRVSMGSVFLVPWAFFNKTDFPKPEKAVRYLKNSGFTTAAMALRDNNISVNSPLLKSSDKLALFLGSEGEGLTSETINNCDLTVKIPMYNEVDSLNVAASAAVAFWEIKNQTDKK